MTTAPKNTVAARNATPDARPQPHPAPQREDKGNFYGIVVMQLSVFFFVTNDTLTKLIGNALPTGQIVFYRGLLSVLAILVVLVLTGHYRLWRNAGNPVVVFRGLAEAVAAIMFLTALKHLPLANVSAILLTIPLVTTAAAALFLGEEVRLRRWSAIFVGMIGVLAIVRPGLEGFNFYSLFALGAVIMASFRDLIARRIPTSSSLWVVTFTTMTFSGLGGAILGTSENWLAIEGSSFLLLAGAALFLTLGQYSIVIAMNNGEVSVVSSFRYISMPIALAYGFFLWHEVPDSLTWVGISLILSSGIYTIFRERQVVRMEKSRRDGHVIAAKTEPRS